MRPSMRRRSAPAPQRLRLGLTVILLLAILSPWYFHVSNTVKAKQIDRSARLKPVLSASIQKSIVPAKYFDSAATSELRGVPSKTPKPQVSSRVPATIDSVAWHRHNASSAASTVAVFPVFVKLHVVGSSTFTSMLRCLAATRSVPAFRLVGHGYWNAKYCGQEQGHQAAELLPTQGVQALACCVKESSLLQLPGAQIRFIALLRNPVEKYISSLFTFVQGEAKRALLGVPIELVTIETFNSAAVNVRGNKSAVKLIPDPRKRGLARQRIERDTRTRGSMHEIRDVFRIPERLRAFSVVGVMEKYDEFLVLVGLVFQWPMETLCFRKKLHTNPSR